MDALLLKNFLSVISTKSTWKYLFPKMFWPTSYVNGTIQDSVFNIVSELRPHE